MNPIEELKKCLIEYDELIERAERNLLVFDQLEDIPIQERLQIRNELTDFIRSSLESKVRTQNYIIELLERR